MLICVLAPGRRTNWAAGGVGNGVGRAMCGQWSAPANSANLPRPQSPSASGTVRTAKCRTEGSTTGRACPGKCAPPKPICRRARQGFWPRRYFRGAAASNPRRLHHKHDPVAVDEASVSFNHDAPAIIPTTGTAPRKPALPFFRCVTSITRSSEPSCARSSPSRQTSPNLAEPVSRASVSS